MAVLNAKTLLEHSAFCDVYYATLRKKFNINVQKSIQKFLCLDETLDDQTVIRAVNLYAMHRLGNLNRNLRRELALDGGCRAMATGHKLATLHMKSLAAIYSGLWRR